MSETESSTKLSRKERRRANPGLVTQTIRSIRENLKLYLGIVALVALPTTLISSFVVSDPANGDAGLSVYLSIATLLMNIALVWTAGQREDGYKVRVADAYYDGTATAVRFVLVAILLVIICLPATFGILLYQYGSVSSTASVTSGEKALLIVLALILALPTILGLARMAFAMQIVVDQNVRPIAAFRRSFAITRRRVRYVLGHFLKLFAVFMIVVIPVAVALAFANNPFVIALLDFIVLLLLLPFMNIYLYKLYRSLLS